MTANTVCPLPCIYYSRKIKESHTARYCKLISCRCSKTLWAQTLVSACSTSPFAPWELLKKHRSFRRQRKHRFYLIVLNLDGFGQIWDSGHQKNTQSTIYPVWWTLQVSQCTQTCKLKLLCFAQVLGSLHWRHVVGSQSVEPRSTSRMELACKCTAWVILGLRISAFLLEWRRKIFVHPSLPWVLYTLPNALQYFLWLCVIESLSLCMWNIGTSPVCHAPCL